MKRVNVVDTQIRDIAVVAKLACGGNVRAATEHEHDRARATKPPVAGAGVLNTVVLQTRERVHDLGVFRAVAMTPRQTVAMVLCSVAGTGLLAGVLAVPARDRVHQYVIPGMAGAAGLSAPAPRRMWSAELGLDREKRRG